MSYLIPQPYSENLDRLDGTAEEQLAALGGVNASALQAALPAPLYIAEGEEYYIPARQQVVVASSIKVDGTVKIDGSIYKVDDKDAVWAEVHDKPDEFPPAPHVHVTSDVVGLPHALDSKASIDHIHANATQSTSGFMSASDKLTLDLLAAQFAPTITAQPTATEVYEGQTVTYSVTATSSVGSLSYQWGYSVDEVTWIVFTGATSSSYTTDALPASFDGVHISCLVSNGISSVRSNAVQQSVWTPSKLGSKLAAWFRHDQHTYSSNNSLALVANVGDPVGTWAAINNTDIRLFAGADSRRPTKESNALAFDGVGNYYNGAGAEFLSMTKSVSYFACFVRMVCASSQARLLGVSTGTSATQTRFVLLVSGTELLVSTRRLDSGSAVSTTATLDDKTDEMCGIGAVRDYAAGRSSLYRDSELVASDTSIADTGTVSATDTLRLRFGVHLNGDTGNLITKPFAEMVLVNQALTSEEELKLAGYVAR